MAQLSFSNFGQTVASKDNVLLSWSTPHSDAGTWVSAFRGLTEGEFFAPQQGMDSALFVLAAGGGALGIAGEGSAQIVIFEWDDEANLLRSEPLRVTLPTSHIPDEGAVRPSQVTLKVTGSGASNARWEGTLCVEAGELLAEGSIVIPRTGAFKMPAKPVSLSTIVPPVDSLASCAGSAVSSGLYPVVQGTVGVWAFEGKGGKEQCLQDRDLPRVRDDRRGPCRRRQRGADREHRGYDRQGGRLGRSAIRRLRDERFAKRPRQSRHLRDGSRPVDHQRG